MTAEAQQLREQWDKKVNFFAGGKADLFESEYPFDSTGFESTHAIARYAVKHAERSGEQETQTFRWTKPEFHGSPNCRQHLLPRIS